MKRVNSTTLFTSDSETNKYLLARVQLSEQVNDRMSLCGLLFTNRLLDVITQEELDRILFEHFDIQNNVTRYSRQVRELLASKGYCLDILSDDPSILVLSEVASIGAYLNKFVNHENASIRAKVAKHGYALNVLVNDEDWTVRIEVAKHGYELHKLARDESQYVRSEVASLGACLHILAFDESSEVRRHVAEHGYALNLLENDSNASVRLTAQRARTGQYSV